MQSVGRVNTNDYVDVEMHACVNGLSLIVNPLFIITQKVSEINSNHDYYSRK